jgi:hypothetical protein
MAALKPVPGRVTINTRALDVEWLLTKMLALIKTRKKCP